MTRATRNAARFFAMVMMMVSIAIVAHPAGATAQSTGLGQAMSSQIAGSASVGFSDAWVYDAASSDPETAFMTHADLPGTIFIYGEITDPTIRDAETGIEMFAEGFFGAFGDGDHAVVDSGTIATDTTWRLYTLSLETIPFGAYVSADATSIPGDVIITLLVSPLGSFDLATVEVQEGITINGVGTSMMSFDPAALSATLQGGGPVSATTPEASATVETVPDLTLPPLGAQTPESAQVEVQLTENVSVGGAQVSWGGDWTYSDEASTPDQIAFFLNEASFSTFFGYAMVPSVPGDVSTSLAEFTDGFFEEFGAVNVVEVASEALPSGNGYALFTGELMGMPLVILAHADVTTAANEFRAQVLITPVEEFDAVFASVQQSFAIDGDGAMTELDSDQLAALLGTNGADQQAAGATATPGADTATTTQDEAFLADFLLRDAEGSCDAVGWVVTAPDQAPVSEEDVNYLAACVGGGTFVARCGTFVGSGELGLDPGEGRMWVQCEIQALADSGPLTLTRDDFSLLDSAGMEYTLDSFALLVIPEINSFPNDVVPIGATAEGTVAFSVPVNAPGPLVIQVNAEALVATGEGPGMLVIDGQLQPIEAFGQ